jgi:hypothetical protein
VILFFLLLLPQVIFAYEVSRELLEVSDERNISVVARIEEQG